MLARLDGRCASRVAHLHRIDFAQSEMAYLVTESKPAIRPDCHEDVEPAQLVYRHRDEFVAPVLPCDVAGKFDGGASFCLYQFDDLLRIVSLCRQIRDGNIGSLTRRQ